MGNYRLTTEAKDELSAGVSFYDSEYPGLGQDFAVEVRRLCRIVAESPESGFELRSGLRRRILRRFPYSILYTIDDDTIVVIAVAHQRRKPGYWTHRV